VLVPGKKGLLDRKIYLEMEKPRAPSHLERCFWLKLLSENEYRVHTNAPPMGKGEVVSAPFGVMCPNCEAMIEGTNEHGSFYFAYMIVDALNGSSLEQSAIKYRLNISEGKKLDEIYEELRKHNFIGIIDTRKKTFKKLEDTPPDLPPINARIPTFIR